MPVESCPITDRELAEFALGPGRSRLVEADFHRVAAHVAACAACRRDYADYLARAERPVLPPTAAEDPDVETSLRNVMTRFRADLTERTREETTAAVTARWRRRAVIAAALALIAGAAVTLWFERDDKVEGEPRPSFEMVEDGEETGVTAGKTEIAVATGTTAATSPATEAAAVPAEGGGRGVGGGDSPARPRPPTPLASPPASPQKSFNQAMTEQTHRLRDELSSWEESLATGLEGLDHAAALSLLAEEGGRVGKLPPTRAGERWPILLARHEELWRNVADGPLEKEALLALSRAFRRAGRPDEALQAFERYAALAGDAAAAAATAASLAAAPAAGEKPENSGEAKANAAALAGRQAAAAAYREEISALYEAAEHDAVIDLAERLMKRYPQSARAYEGQLVAARSYVANHQPTAAVACYRRVVERCPDEAFAREAAKSTVLMLERANRLDESIAACREWRTRFVDDDFRQFALLREAAALRRKGRRHHGEAAARLRELRDIGTESLHARLAEAWLRDLNRGVTREAMKGLSIN